MPYCTPKITVDVSVTSVDTVRGFAILIASTAKEIDMSGVQIIEFGNGDKVVTNGQ